MSSRILRLVLAPASPTAAPAAVVPVPGSPAPELALLALATDRPTLMLFTDPHCDESRELQPDLERWRDRDDLDVLVVSARLGGPEQGDALFDPQRRIFTAYGVTSTPAALILADGRAATRLVSGAGAVRALAWRRR